MKFKCNWKIILMCFMWFVIGAIVGYGIAVYAANRASSADFIITCDDGAAPDENGCCTGEVYTDMGVHGFNCCPTDGGDCFPPIK